jgi:hypothetical protein
MHNGMMVLASGVLRVCARVENISVHDTVSAYVESSELCATPNHSGLDSRRHDSIECIPLDDRLPLSIDNLTDALLEDEIFYRVVPLPHQICRTSSLLANAIISWNHLRKRMDVFAIRSEHWIGRACLTSFYAVGL